MEKAEWFFDVVSPFSYLAFHSLETLRDKLDIRPVPILFAALLKHWGTLGPAELPSKRIHTYQFCVWLARRQGIPFKMPPRHPFNPLAAQRLLVSLGSKHDDVGKALDLVFADGRDPEFDFPALAERLGVDDAEQRAASADAKRQLRDNTQRAIDLGVFGVPTLILRGRLFWGSDTIRWADEFCSRPELFDDPEYAAAARTEVGVRRGER
ncbi:DsbA family protein [Caballeronia sp. LZ062]|uniref:2-hydroxychromene-2-carboxylate isomerase n=1 Tax=unclassified Caballeronia TaxID=2646786 RepID=UPI002861F1FF|nr:MULTISPECIES: DsbA family protein [unclassified Caballeronia]MDR5857775.1 DsbA family protein [Caballeronia sp. LZ050]MDR5869325.1 DsbA family protein [Caballeronia sp. LZ062]